MTFLEDVIKRCRDADAARPRSQQVEVGWSEAGGCRAALGFRLSGAWPSDETDSWPAQRGTALHDFLEPILAEPGVRTELDTMYRGIPGHADLVGPDWLGDLKTKTRASSTVWRTDLKAMRQARIQASGYAAGLVDTGELPEDATIRLLIVPADGGYRDWWCHEEPFDRSLADEGADRVDWVREQMAAGAPLPKDKPAHFCESYCQFYSLCRGADASDDPVNITDPETVAAVAAYVAARDRETAAKNEKFAIADLVRGLRGRAGDYRVGLSEPGEPSEVLDEEWIRADYAARGEPVPVTWKPGSAPKLSITKARKPKGAAV
jgi:hypothetical protein